MKFFALTLVFAAALASATAVFLYNRHGDPVQDFPHLEAVKKMTNVRTAGQQNERPVPHWVNTPGFLEIISRPSTLVSNEKIVLSVAWASSGPMSLERQVELLRASLLSRETLSQYSGSAPFPFEMKFDLNDVLVEQKLSQIPDQQTREWFQKIIYELEGVISRTQVALNSPRPVDVLPELADYSSGQLSFSQPNRDIAIAAVLTFQIARIDPELANKLFEQVMQMGANKIQYGLMFPVDVDVSYGIARIYNQELNQHPIASQLVFVESESEKQTLSAWLREGFGMLHATSSEQLSSQRSSVFPVSLTGALYQNSLLKLP
jgi:hypothetical protein